MRRFASLFLASVLMVGVVGCTVDEEGNLWVDPCLGTCFADEVCWDGVCEAPYSDACCDDYCDYAVCAFSDGSFGCADLNFDSYNCGGCEVYCEGTCSFGECQGADYSCADVGLDECDGYCTDTSTDELNCGGCYNECAYDEVCLGACYGGDTSCETYGYTTCTDGCVDLLTDNYNCGDCGIECVAGCDGGECL